MENRLSYILVGAFVFVLLIGGVFSILWLGNYSDEGTFKFYKVDIADGIINNNKSLDIGPAFGR